MTRLVHITTVSQSLIFLEGQLAYMQERGLDITAICSPDEALDAFGRRHGVQTCGVQMPRRISVAQDLVALAQLVAQLRRIKPQIVHAHTPKGGLLGMIAATLAGVPGRVYHMRGLPLETATGSRKALLTWTERVSCALAHQVICVSPSLRQVALDHDLCRPPQKLRVLAGGSGNGVEAKRRFNPSTYSPQTRQQVRHRLGISPDALVVGFIGRLVRDKGVVELAQAWASLRQRHPHARLLIVGPFEPRDPVPEDTAAALRADPSVHLLGFQDQTPPLYLAMDLVVLPTYREGFPNVPLEAAAMGLPVVSTRVPGCVDAIVEERTGLLVPARDALALERAMERYMVDDALRAAHGRAAQARVRQDFDQERIWSALHQVYLDLLARSA